MGSCTRMGALHGVLHEDKGLARGLAQGWGVEQGLARGWGLCTRPCTRTRALHVASHLAAPCRERAVGAVPPARPAPRRRLARGRHLLPGDPPQAALLHRQRPRALRAHHAARRRRLLPAPRRRCVAPGGSCKGRGASHEGFAPGRCGFTAGFCTGGCCTKHLHGLCEEFTQGAHGGVAQHVAQGHCTQILPDVLHGGIAGCVTRCIA